MALVTRGTTDTGSKPRVVYIGSCSRSGSTLLAMLFGTAEGVFTAGEIRYLWDRAILKGALCSCGKRYEECPVWHQVLTESILGGPPKEIAKRVVDMQKNQVRLRYAQRIYRSVKAERLSPELAWYRDLHSRVQARLCEVTKSHTVVDSSKYPQEALLFTTARNIDFRFVHLIRDARGVVSSWNRAKKEYDGLTDFMPSKPVYSSAAQWTWMNLGCERIANLVGTHATRVRYENLATDPDNEMQRLTRNLNIPESRQDRLYSETNHVISGNPDRFRRRPKEIRLDERWRDDLGRWDRFVTWVLTAPLQRRYDNIDVNSKTYRK